MQKILLSSLVLAGAVAMATMSPAALATPIPWTVGVGSIASGGTPAGTPPWLTATFQQTGTNTGTLTLTSLLSGGEVLKGTAAKVPGWAFNFGDTLTALSCTSGACAASAVFGGTYTGGPQSGSTGNFNTLFTWTPQSTFGAGDTAEYAITFTSTLMGNPFAVNASGNSSLAHIQGLAIGNSVWATSGDPQGGTTVPVPEPAEIGMFGLGLALLGGLLGLERRRRVS